MSISVTCPECDHTFSVRNEYAGKRGKCPHCGGVFRAEPSAPSVGVAMPAALASRSGVSLGGSSGANGGFAIDTAAPSHAPAPAGRKSGGKRKKSARSQHTAPSMPIWGWITIATLGVAAFVGGGLVFWSRAGDAIKIAERIDDGSEAESTKQKLLDEIKILEDEIATLKGSLAAAEKSIGVKPKEKGPLGEIEKRIVPGVVKVIPYINDRPQQSTATGFLIEAGGKTLVVTTHRVCEGANKIGIKLATGTEYEVEGIVAEKPNQDIAILKPKSEMPGAGKLTIAENVVLSRGDTVYAIGNPGKQEFTTSRGVITRVLPQDKYLGENPKFDVAMRRDAAANADFIEHDARIFPGDYGGPLLNANLDVIGMNQVLVTMVMNDGRTIVQTFGAAEEIKHVISVAKMATDTIIPYPPAPKKPPKKDDKKDDKKEGEDEDPSDEGDETKPDDDPPADESEDGESEDGDDKPAAEGLAGKIDALYDECEAFDWTPEGEEEYGKLADIARRVTEAKELDDDDDQKEAADKSADKVLERLAELDWDDSDELEKLNELAVAATVEKDAGIFLAGTVRGVAQFNEKPGLMVQIDGSDSFALVVTDKAAGVSPGSKWLLLGQYDADQGLPFKSPEDGTEGTAFLIRSKALVPLGDE